MFQDTIPNLPKEVNSSDFFVPKELKLENWDSYQENAFFDDYIGEEINHLDGQTIEEVEHQIATRLYQNNARVHFNQHVEKMVGLERIIYGGYLFL